MIDIYAFLCYIHIMARTLLNQKAKSSSNLDQLRISLQCCHHPWPHAFLILFCSCSTVANHAKIEFDAKIRSDARPIIPASNRCFLLRL